MDIPEYILKVNLIKLEKGAKIAYILLVII